MFSDSLPAATDVQTKLLGSGAFTSVGLYDVSKQNVSLTLPQLLQYNAILVWGNSAFYNSAQLGDVLASYINAGGGVVEAVWSTTGTPQTSITGGYVPYKPYTTIGEQTGVDLSFVRLQDNSPLLTGVYTFNGGFRSYQGVIQANQNGTTVANWSNGVPLVIQHNTAAVVVLNFYLPSSDFDPFCWDSSTNGAFLIRNALQYVSGCVGMAACEGEDAGPCPITVNTLTNCGGCGIECSLPNAVEDCSLGYCKIESCASNYCEVAKILIIHASSSLFVNDVRNKIMNTGYFDAVDLFDAVVAIPSISLLTEYQSVLIFSDKKFSDHDLLGDVIADYLDVGGGVVDCVFSNGNPDSEFTLTGRYYNEGYVPYISEGETGFYSAFYTLIPDNITHPLLKDVISFNGGYNSFQAKITLNNNATQVAHWSNGYPLVTYKQKSVGTVVSLNFFPPSSDVNADYWNASTSGAILMRNALLYTAKCNFFDCDGIPDNGCETSLGSVDNCGRCGNVCELPHAISSCLAGSCVISKCDTGFANCDDNLENGCELVAKNLTHCGGCNTTCVIPNAIANCSSGICTFVQCITGFNDCDNDLSNGCESDLHSVSNCGSCGTLCWFPNAIASCSNGTCTFDSCITPTTEINCSLSILVIAAEDPSNIYRVLDVVDNLKKFSEFTKVDYFLATEVVPSLNYLLRYTSVLVYSQSSFGDSITLGNNLADYIDLGGTVVQALRTLNEDYYQTHMQVIGGRFAAEYAPFEYGYHGCDGNCSVGKRDQNDLKVIIQDSPFLFEVETFIGDYYFSYVKPTDGAIIVAEWQNTYVPLIMYKQTATTKVVALNFFPPSSDVYGGEGTSWYSYTDGDKIMRNALIAGSSCFPAHNCDGILSNGCETLPSIENCQGCGISCEIPPAVANVTCVRGMCEIRTCQDGFGDCDGEYTNGCEADLTSGPYCGKCDFVCEDIPNAVAACIGDQCILSSCLSGFADCDGNIANGCEANLNNSVNNCGKCNNICALPYATTACNNGKCEFNSCLSQNMCANQTTLNSVLIVCAEDVTYCNAVKNVVIASGSFSIVDTFDARYDLPTLSELLVYQSVLVWSNYQFNDSQLLGDTLADYIDQGGGVVQCVYTTNNDYYTSIGGRFAQDYQPFTLSQGMDSYYYGFLNPVIPGHDLLVGVSSVNFGSYSRYGRITLDPDSVLVANWNFGVPLVFYKQTTLTPVVCLNFYPVPNTVDSQNWRLSKDGINLIRNALIFASGCYESADCDGVPENGCDPLNTLSNCGFCGNDCELSNSIGTCTNSTCEFLRCKDGYSDCDNNLSNGCEKNIHTLSDCGVCNKNCSSLPNVKTVECKYDKNNGYYCNIIACNEGFLDCDKYELNGCETSNENLNSVSNCGNCGIICSYTNGQPECSNGECVTTSCNSGLCPNGPSVLLLAADWNLNSARDVILSTGAFTNVVIYNATYSIPDLSYLQQFDVVYTWSNYGYSNKYLYGNLFASYIDWGGSVIISTFSLCCGNDFGNLSQYDYLPYFPDTTSYNDYESWKPVIPDHPLLLNFVNFSSNIYYSRVITRPGSTVVAKLSNGIDFVSYRLQPSGGMVIMINMLPNPYHWGPSDLDVKYLWRNALNFGSNCVDSAVCPGETSCIALNTPDNCLSCGNVCNVTNAESICTLSGCQIKKCIVPYGSCNGTNCDTDLSTIQNCGWCGNNCSVVNGVPGCNGSSCIILSCDEGYADCDNNYNNGCETYLVNDTFNCGKCDNLCYVPYADSSCADGTCVKHSCNPSTCVLPSVLILYTYGNVADVQSKLLAQQAFSVVEIRSICCSDIQLVDLQPYQVVLIYSDGYNIYNSTNVGNVLEAYLLQGGGVVQCLYTTSYQYDSFYSVGINGNWPQYQPFTGYSSWGSYSNIYLTKLLPNHELLFEVKNVTSYNWYSLSLGYISPTADAVVVAEWYNSGPIPGVLYSQKPGLKPVVALNFIPESSDVNLYYWDSKSDGAELIRNALLFSADCMPAADCGGICLPIFDKRNCGGCGSRCTLPNAVTTCLSGECKLKECVSDFGNCNGDESDGCENPLTSNDNCGACNVSCTVTNNGVGVCENQTCKISLCDEGFGDCDGEFGNGCETNFSDPSSCGGCNTQCYVPYTESACASPVCSSSSCTVSNQPNTRPDILLIYFNTYDQYYVSDSLSRTGMLNSISYFNASNGVPLLSDLEPYDAVLVWSNYYNDDGTLGDVLGAYIEEGGGVVQMLYTYINGKYGTNYAPVEFTSLQSWNYRENYDYINPIISNHVILENVESFNGGYDSYQNPVIPKSDAYVVAKWALSGRPLIVYRKEISVPVVFLNFYPASSNYSWNFWNSATNGGVIMANALLYSSNRFQSQDCGFGCISLNDVNNCGQCGFDCLSRPGVTDAECNFGECSIVSCTAGTADCDYDWQNGCESNATNNTQCSGCGVVCSPPNADAFNCDTGVCTIVNCTYGWLDCDGDVSNGCEVYYYSDFDHCGSCNNSCNLEGASTVCDEGVCRVVDCLLTDSLFGKTLIMYSDGDGGQRSNYIQQNLLQLGRFSVVDTFNLRANLTISLEKLKQYGSILFYTEYDYYTPNLIGNLIADYIDWGGNLVQMGYSTRGDVNWWSLQIGGRYYAQKYAPYYFTSSYNCCPYQYTYPNIANHPLLKGVYSYLETNLFMNNAVREGATTVLTLNSGQPYLYYNEFEKGAAIVINTMPPRYYGDYYGYYYIFVLMANSLQYRRNAADCGNFTCIYLNTTENCGSCGNVCDLPHTNATDCTISGVCVIVSCSGGYLDCDEDPTNGCETLLDDIYNCGACGNACNSTNANMSCSNGLCQIISCNEGYIDCNGNPNDGCEESSALRSIQNCGSCNNTCSYEYGVGYCTDNGTCVLDYCESYYNQCDAANFDILILHAENVKLYVADVYDSLFSTKAFSSIDIRYANSGNLSLSLEFLQNYKAVLIFADQNFLNTPALGNVLADYIDSGGGVVFTLYALNNFDPNNLVGQTPTGRLLSGGYLPIYNNYGGSWGGGQYMYFESTHPLLQDVNTYYGGYGSARTYFLIDSASTIVAYYPDGYPFIFYKQQTASPLVVLNMFPVSYRLNSYYWQIGGDLLMRNALYFSANCDIAVADCDGSCELANTVDSCGGCGVPCNLIEGTSSICSFGECIIVNCTYPFEDCNGDPSDGCEINLLEDTYNCGYCNSKCFDINQIANGTCVNGVCQIDSCIPSYLDCNGNITDGCEQYVNSMNSCGDCDTECYINNSISYCSSGNCTFSQCVGKLCLPLKILLIYADNFNAMIDVRTKLLSTGAFVVVDALYQPNDPYFQNTSLYNYDAVLVWCNENYYFRDSNNFGYNLMNFVYNGRGVVQAFATTLPTSGNYFSNSLGWNYYNIQPFYSNGFKNNSQDNGNMVVRIEGHPILTGVNEFKAKSSYGTLGVQSSNIISTWGDGTPMVLARQVNNAFTVALNFYPVSSDYSPIGWDSSLDGTKLLRNALIYSANCFNSMDCDNDTSNGCESLLSPQNCGGCGNTCSFPNGVGICFYGNCTLEDCNPGFANCNGLSSDGCEAIVNDTNNCGGCGVVCNLPNAQSSCSNGKCVIISCNGGFADCDGFMRNGCESLLNSTIHCGNCNNTCSFPNAVGTCTNNKCEIKQCNTAKQCDTPPKILILHAAAIYQAFDNLATHLYETGAFTEIVVYSVEHNNPTLDFMLQYDAILVWSRDVYYDAVALGDLLADYVDSGRGVIEAAASVTETKEQYQYYNTYIYDYYWAYFVNTYWNNREYCYSYLRANQIDGNYYYWDYFYYYYYYFQFDGVNVYNIYDPTVGCGVNESRLRYLTVKGRFFSDGYKPFTTQGLPLSMYDYITITNNSHPLLYQVNNFTLGNYGRISSLTAKPGAVIAAEYQITKQPLIIYHLIGSTPVIAFNSYPYSDEDDSDGWDYTTDGAILLRNLLLFASKCGIATANCDNNVENGCELLNTVDNCGSCGNSCSLPNATPSCSSGACNILQCNRGYDNCDLNVTNGCEPLNTIANCGKCQNECRANNAITTCESGSCEIFACKPGYSDCDGLVSTGCESTQCEECAIHCDPPNAQAISCYGTDCIINQCIPPYYDCNNDYTDGCESDITSNVTHCGNCGTNCLLLPSVISASCSDSVCVIDQCAPLKGDCNHDPKDGCERTLNDLSHCGDCNIDCYYNNVISPACSNGTCEILQCSTVYADCDGNVTTGCEHIGVCPGDCPLNYDDCNLDASDGCEISLLIDVDHCGACINKCPTNNTVPSCVNGKCVISSCTNGYANCDSDNSTCEHQGVCPGTCSFGTADCNLIADDGCETPINTPLQCGSCTNVCNLTNAVPKCNSSLQCAIDYCQGGYSSCDGNDSNGCEFLGVCPGGCPAGFADCNLNSNDACEISLSNITTCGGCTTKCNDTNTIPGCVLYNCTVVSCTGEYSDCDLNPDNGCEFLGVCPGSCPTGFADCNHMTSDGCETYLYQLNTCGDCFNACDLPEAIPLCDADFNCVVDHCINGYSDCTPAAGCETKGVCPGTCPIGYGDCDISATNGCETSLNSDTDCGKCGTACSYPFAMTSCATGTCTITGCLLGRSHCSGDVKTGCETQGVCPGSCPNGMGDCNLSSDDSCETPLNTTANCGSCGFVCNLPNATALCTDLGVCEIASCDFGNTNCDNNHTNGCEHPFTNCPQPCPTGFAECNGNWTDLCETNLTSLSNCGSCGKQCALPGALSDCSSGNCTLLACIKGLYNCDFNDANGCESSTSCPLNCTAGLGDCDRDSNTGCETDLNSAVTDCGACNNSCIYPNGTGKCVNGKCQLAGCGFGYLDCDGNSTNGCEEYLKCPLVCSPGFGNCNQNETDGCETSLTTLSNCAECFIGCNILNAASSCTTGTCKFISCNAGWGDCNAIPGCETPLTTLSNCGGCNVNCSLANATSSCVTGVCNITSCNNGYLNCDANDSNGCETPFSVQFCGNCSNNCNLLPNVKNTSCIDGNCTILTCATGFGNCDGNHTNGCETPLNTLTDCGSCAARCPTLPNSVPACTNGTCNIANCLSGFSDCNTILSDGCETALSTLTNCGGCGKACSFPNAAANCVNGICSMGACSPGFYDCVPTAPGCETIANTLSTCGGCDSSCTLPNAIPSCTVNGTCVIASCLSGYKDCDFRSETGCETQISTIQNCGDCQVACNLPNATSVCKSGECTVGSCNSGFLDCDKVNANGCEAILNSNQHCGGCNATCAAENAVTNCTTGTCKISSCVAGFLDCDGVLSNGCETVNNTIEDCGACERICDLDHADAICIEGRCSVNECFNSFGDCDGDASNGCEQSLNTKANCGKCNTPCDLPNAISTCFQQECTLQRCNQGFADNDNNPENGCEDIIVPNQSVSQSRSSSPSPFVEPSFSLPSLSALPAPSVITIPSDTPSSSAFPSPPALPTTIAINPCTQCSVQINTTVTTVGNSGSSGSTTSSSVSITGQNGQQVGSIIIAPTSEDILVSVTGSNIVAPKSSVSAVVSITFYDAKGNPVTTLPESIEICLATDGGSKNDACLSYFDESSGEWKCQDPCLKESDNNTLCGKTDHLTSFAILLDASGSGGSSKCGDNNTFDIYFWLSIAFIIAAIIIFIVVSVVYDLRIRISNRMLWSTVTERIHSVNSASA